MLLGWQQAFYLAAVVGLAALALRIRRSALWPWAAETALLLVLFGLWQEGLNLGSVHVAGGASHGMRIWRAERWLHLPSERSIQRAVLHVPDVMRALNAYYSWVHVEDVIVCLLWLFWRHRDRYKWARRALTYLTLLTMVLQFVPVAPPRLLPATGVVDAGRLLGHAIYPLNGLHDTSQLTAMPSVHVAWALWVAVVVLRASPSRWRWIVLAHPILTVASVIAPGYHFWADAIAAAVLLALVLFLMAVGTGRSTVGVEEPAVHPPHLRAGDVDAPAETVCGSQPHVHGRHAYSMTLSWGGGFGRAWRAGVAALGLLALMAPVGAQPMAILGCGGPHRAIAHRSGGRVVVPQPGGAPRSCETATGFGGAETQLVVTNDGTVVYEPAILTPGLAGTGFLAGAPGPRPSTQVSPAGLAVTHDAGRTWSFRPPAGVTWVAQDDSLYVDRTTGRVFYYALGANPAPQAGIPLLDQVPGGYAHLMMSSDNGQTFAQTAVPGYIESENPRFTAAPPRPGLSVPANYPNVVYWCGNNMLFAETYRACYRSFDGGVSWEFASILFSLPLPQHRECGANGEVFTAGDGNYPEGAPDGSLYVLVACGAATYLARSTDEGSTWPLVTTKTGTPLALPAADELRVDPHGNLYLFRLVAGSQVQLRVSRDHGTTWTAAVDMTPPGVTNVLQWSVAERGIGEVAVSYLAQRAGQSGYDGYLTVTREGLAASPLFWSTTINDPARPMMDSKPPDARDDFIGVDIGPDGTPWAGFYGSCRAGATDPACRGQSADPESNQALAGRLVWPAS